MERTMKTLKMHANDGDDGISCFKFLSFPGRASR